MTRAIAAFVFTVLLAAAPGATAAPAAAGESAPMAPGAYTPIALVAPSVIGVRTAIATRFGGWVRSASTREASNPATYASSS